MKIKREGKEGRGRKRKEERRRLGNVEMWKCWTQSGFQAVVKDGEKKTTEKVVKLNHIHVALNITKHFTGFLIL